MTKVKVGGGGAVRPGNRGTGDVVATTTSTDGDIVLFEGTTGKKIKTSGITLSSISNTRSILVTSTTTLTPNVDDYDLFIITAQSTALLLDTPTGTPVLGNGFMVD